MKIVRYEDHAIELQTDEDGVLYRSEPPREGAGPLETECAASFHGVLVDAWLKAVERSGRGSNPLEEE